MSHNHPRDAEATRHPWPEDGQGQHRVEDQQPGIDLARQRLDAAGQAGVRQQHRIPGALDAMGRSRIEGGRPFVVVAGKGHETGQTIAGETLPFSDRDELRRLLGPEVA